MPKNLKYQLQEKKKELTDKLNLINKNINELEQAWLPEVVIRKQDYEMGIPKYQLDRDDQIIVDVYFPNVSTGNIIHNSNIKYTMDEFRKLFVEFSPKVRRMYQKE